MAAGNKNDTVTFVLVLCLIFATLAGSSGFVRNITQEPGLDNRSSGSGNWNAVSGGRPVRSDPNTFHHHKTRTENGGGGGGGSRAAVPSPRPVRSDTNTFHHHKSRTENGGGSSSSRSPSPLRDRSDQVPTLTSTIASARHLNHELESYIGVEALSTLIPFICHLN